MIDEETARDLVYAYGASLTTYNRTLVVVPVAQPAAGAEWSATVPAGSLWVPLSIRSVFTTSATVATRIPTLAINQAVGGQQISRINAAQNVVANNAPVVCYLRGYGVTSNIGAYGAPFPNMPLVAGMELRTITGALQVDDQYSGIVLYVLQVTPRTTDELVDYITELRGGSPRWDAFAGAELGL